jgi:hypothetical protein
LIFQSEYNPHESREPSGDDQETTEEPVPKVRNQISSILRTRESWNNDINLIRKK